MGKIVSTKRIVGAQATGETCDIVINHEGKMPYWEGQSYGVIPPGTNPKNGKPYTNRLYSIASSRYGDDMKGTSTTLCVRRSTYWCPELQADDPAKKGVCTTTVSPPSRKAHSIGTIPECRSRFATRIDRRSFLSWNSAILNSLRVRCPSPLVSASANASLAASARAMALLAIASAF